MRSTPAPRLCMIPALPAHGPSFVSLSSRGLLRQPLFLDARYTHRYATIIGCIVRGGDAKSEDGGGVGGPFTDTPEGLCHLLHIQGGDEVCGKDKTFLQKRYLDEFLFSTKSTPLFGDAPKGNILIFLCNHSNQCTYALMKSVTRTKILLLYLASERKLGNDVTPECQAIFKNTLVI